VNGKRGPSKAVLLRREFKAQAALHRSDEERFAIQQVWRSASKVARPARVACTTANARKWLERAEKLSIAVLAAWPYLTDHERFHLLNYAVEALAFARDLVPE
jgi:hypothetical protein